MSFMSRIGLLASGGARVAAVDYNGTTSYLNRGASLNGITDSSTGILSAWFRIDSGDGTNRGLILGSTTSGFVVSLSAANLFNIVLQDSTVSSTYTFASSAHTASSTWLNVLASWDTGFLPASRLSHLYINDVSDKSVGTNSGSAFNVYYSQPDFLVGALSGAGGFYSGCAAEIYFAPGQYLDFSVSANRRKFITALGEPANLGTDGSVPTGTPPKVYLRNPASSYGTNSGGGGNFTVNGSFAACSSSP